MIVVKRLLVLFAILYGSNIHSYSQTEKEIVSRYRAALHKTVEESSIHSIELKGVFTMQKIDLPLSIYYQSPNLRVEMSFQNVTFLQISNDSLKWEYNPMNETNAITRIAKHESGWAKQNSSFDFVNYEVLNYEKLNLRLQLKRKERIDTVDVYVLELSDKGKTKSTLFINSKSGLIYKVEDEKGYRHFANYSNTNGYVFPRYVLESNAKQKIEVHFNQLAFNKTLEDSLFVIPKYAFNKKVSTMEGSEKNLLTAGDSLYRIGLYNEAIQHYSKAIKGNDHNAYCYNARGLAKIELKEYYEAIADFNKALEINPKSANSQNNVGLAKYYLGDHNGAIKDYTKALEIEPALLVAYKNRGVIYLETEKYDLAAADFSTAIKLQPDDAVAHFKLGVALAEQGKYEDALTSYSVARKNKYTSADIYNYKGVSEYRLEKYDSACASFAQALMLSPGDLQYVENYGRSLFELGDYEKASQQFESYLKKQNDNASIHNMNGLCKYHEENYKGAIKDFSRSIELDGKEATYFDNRASAKEMLEDYEGAIRDYGESIAIYPNDASVFFKRGMLKINTSKKIEGCLDLATANEMKYEPAKEAIIANCH